MPSWLVIIQRRHGDDHTGLVSEVPADAFGDIRYVVAKPDANIARDISFPAVLTDRGRNAANYDREAIEFVS
ncbi:MAG TPA: hypothetical protein VKU87_07685 [Thermomicrobiaceae bacterium]|nr:hypothetical protein [Thermomicrobiaceae bacterium]